MPLYTLITQDGALSSDAKAKLAMELTTLHSEYAGVPKNWVHVVFQDYAPGCGFTAGEPSATDVRQHWSGWEVEDSGCHSSRGAHSTAFSHC